MNTKIRHRTSWRLRPVSALCAGLLLLACGAGRCLSGAEPLSAVYIHLPLPTSPKGGGVMGTLDSIQACGFNTVFPYANTSAGRAHYPSQLLGSASKSDAGALLPFVAEARRRGLRVQPAVCVLVSGHDRPAGVLEQHPEWALRDPTGRPLGWISPSHPSARAWLVEVFGELIDQVLPDGLLLDYLRYPNQEVELDQLSASGFDAAAPEGETPAARKDRLQRFKEDALTELLVDLKREALRRRPGLQLALYSWGSHVARKHRVAQPWPRWVEQGLIDLLNVSGYCYRDNYGANYLDVFEKRLQGALDEVRRTRRNIPVTFALGLHTSHGTVRSAEEVNLYLQIARRLGVSGVAGFSWAGLQPLLAELIEAGAFRVLAEQPAGAGAAAPIWSIGLEVDLGEDNGQNFGTLFEAVDEEGRVVAGAGFLGAYNTYYRADRHTLHCFIKTSQETEKPVKQTLPRPFETCSTYMFDLGGDVFAVNRSPTGRIAAWNEADQSWVPSEQPPAHYVGGCRLQYFSNRITVDGAEAFRFDPARGSASSYYYANGLLFFHVAEAESPVRQTYLQACPWVPGSEGRVDLGQAMVLVLSTPGEFPYSYGQKDGAVIVGTNTGGVYRFRDGRWEMLVAPDVKTSYQLYAMINYYDRLLMGHYPSGELFEVVDDEVRQVVGWPPRMDGASARAREAQTLTIYGGDLFVGVWPWAELWRYQRNESAWEFVDRLFSAPAVLPSVTAPYEAELAKSGEKVNNLWGQRVTSLIPSGEGLLASSSNKGGAIYEPRLDFLTRWEEYGAVHRFVAPGHLSIPLPWYGGLRTFRFEVTPDGMNVFRENELIGSIRVERGSLGRFRPATVRRGTGVYGPFRGRAIRETNGR